MRVVSIFTGLFLAAVLAVQSQAFETNARAAFVYDLNTSTVLMDKDADRPMPPASMSKLMTLNMVFEALRDGRITLETRFNVSQRASDMGGSTMFLDQTDRPTVEELIKGIIVLSGNDACVAIAEGLAGTEEAFAQQMNQRAKALGMENSTFANASGWPHPNQRMSMRDLGLLAIRLLTEFPEYYGYFSLTEFPWDGRAPANRFNRNPLLPLGIGADGLKTGHTNEAGYGLVGSARQGNRRIIFVITGLNTEKGRAEEAERIVNWAFRQFVERTVVKKNRHFADVPVWLGEAERVGLVAAEDVSMLIPGLVQGQIPGKIRYRSPIQAPVEKGQILGEMEITVPGMPPETVALLADADVPEGGFMPRVRTAARILISQLVGRAREAL